MSPEDAQAGPVGGTQRQAGEGEAGAPASDATTTHPPGLRREYRTERIAVQWDASRCIHSGNCVRGLSKAFDWKRRPWVDPTAATPDDLTSTILRCPSGALHFVRLDGGAQETADVPTTVTPVPHGPYYLRGDLTVAVGDGMPPRHDTRLALCRCTLTARAPFCDNSCQISTRLAGHPTTPPKTPTDGQ